MPKNPDFWLLLRLNWATLGIQPARVLLVNRSASCHHTLPQTRTHPYTTSCHPLAAYFTYPHPLLWWPNNQLKQDAFECEGEGVLTITQAQAGISGTYGHPTQVPSIDSGFKSLQQACLCSFLAQILWFAVFISFALGLRGWDIVMSN